MKTISEIAALTGVSVRTLQYYDEIGLLHPTALTAAGYRLYDEKALAALQQILFFKELDFPLKEIARIMTDPGFSRQETFQRQKALLAAKRDRLDRLLQLLDRLEKGETCMDFEAFDIGGYIQALEDFKQTHRTDIVTYWGSEEHFDELIRRCREHGPNIAQNAIRYYGSVENYVTAMREQMDHFSEHMQELDTLQQEGKVEENQRYMLELAADLTRDVSDPEVQGIIARIVGLTGDSSISALQTTESWQTVIDAYLYNDKFIAAIDKKYGQGASHFIGEAAQYYFDHQKTVHGPA